RADPAAREPPPVRRAHAGRGNHPERTVPIQMKLKTRAPYIATRQPLSRRRFLLGAGVALSLPMLEAMQPRLARAATSPPGVKPRRLLGICNNLGLRPDLFFPVGAG